MDQQRADAKKMYKELSFGKKVEHIWYYYKRSIILVLLALLIICYSVYEIKSRAKWDFEGTFYTEFYVSDEQKEALEEYFAQYVEDINGDGKKNVRIIIASIAALNNEAEGTMAINTKFSTEMAVGVDPFILVDDCFYDTVMMEEYSMAIEMPQELTALPDFKKAVKIPNDAKIYWITRTLYQDEKDDEDAISLHENTKKLEERIFGAPKK